MAKKNQRMDRFDYVNSEIVGEMADLNAITDENEIKELQKGDDDPLVVTMRIPESWSKKNWYYTGKALKSIAHQVNDEKPNGFLGHQNPKDLDYEFPDIATHWVSALTKQETNDNDKEITVLYVKGAVDKSQPDLKRWIRSGRIDQVSIYGKPALINEDGETKVVDWQLYSIDWTPRNRAGMKTDLVDMEMEKEKEGEINMDKKELMEVLGEMGLKKEDKKDTATLEKKLEEVAGEMKKSKEVIEEIAGEMGFKGEDKNLKNVKATIDKYLKMEKKITAGEMESKRAKSLETIENEVIREFAGEMLPNESDDFEGEMAKVKESTVFKNYKNAVLGRKNDNVGGTKGSTGVTETIRQL